MRSHRLGVAALGIAIVFAACAPEAEEESAVEEEVPSQSVQEDPVSSAMSAAPTSISGEARILDWNMNELRAGTNQWTCLPDRSDTPGNDPWCISDAWMNFLDAYVSQTEPTYTEVGFAYMLQGDTPVSNSDPYATEPTGPEDWVTDLGPHLMVLVPDKSLLENISTNHLIGGPWVMWPETPYAHIMIPLESRGP